MFACYASVCGGSLMAGSTRSMPNLPRRHAMTLPATATDNQTFDQRVGRYLESGASLALSPFESACAGRKPNKQSSLATCPRLPIVCAAGWRGPPPDRHLRQDRRPGARRGRCLCSEARDHIAVGQPRHRPIACPHSRQVSRVPADEYHPCPIILTNLLPQVGYASACPHRSHVLRRS
jgi:hypothetical protein